MILLELTTTAITYVQRLTLNLIAKSVPKPNFLYVLEYYGLFYPVNELKTLE